MIAYQTSEERNHWLSRYLGNYACNRCHKPLGGLTPQQAIQRLLIAEWPGMKTYLAFNQPTLAQRLKRHDP